VLSLTDPLTKSISNIQSVVFGAHLKRPVLTNVGVSSTMIERDPATRGESLWSCPASAEARVERSKDPPERTESKMTRPVRSAQSASGRASLMRFSGSNEGERAED
jgi:hypothetical protein